MACHSSHRIFVGLECGLALEGVHLRIVGHHRLVHSVECETLSVGTPEESFLYAELVAVNGLSVDYLTAAVVGYLRCLVVGVGHAELVVFHIHHGFRLAVPFAILLVLAVLSPCDLLFLPVVEQSYASVVHDGLGLVGVRHVGIECGVHLVVVEQLVHLFYIK